MRAHKLRGVAKKGTGRGRPWQIRDMPGSLLVADAFTMPLLKQGFAEFQKLRMTAATVKLAHCEVKESNSNSKQVNRMGATALILT